MGEEDRCRCTSTARGDDTFGCPTHDDFGVTVLTQDQLRSMLAEQAAQIGLTVDDVLELARYGELPKTPRGFGIDLLVGMIAADQSPASSGAGEKGKRMSAENYSANKNQHRPTVGRLVVPYMVDAERRPIDFKVVDERHVDLCATQTRCGICGGKIKRGPIAFVGPDDGRTCFADPWMHPECATLAMQQCPFLTGRVDWREAEGRNEPLLATYSQNMVPMLAWNWRAHRDPSGAWHFEAVGPLTRQEPVA